jgi:hypothetical protein
MGDNSKDVKKKTRKGQIYNCIRLWQSQCFYMAAKLGR